MEHTARSFAVGLATIVAVVGLAVLLLRFGELDRHLDDRWRLVINTDQAAGLRDGSPVEMSGVPVGTVEQVRVRPGARWPVEVTARLDRTALLGVGALPYAKQSLLGGVATLELDAGLDAEPDPAAGEVGLLPRDDSATIEQEMRFRVVEQINSELESRLRPFTEAAQSLTELGNTYRDLGENLAMLTEPVAIDAEGTLDADAPANIATLIARLSRATESVAITLEEIESMFGEEGAATRLSGTISRIDGLVDESTRAATAVADAARSLDENAGLLRDRALPVADQLALALAEVRDLARIARDGEGTMGRMIADPTLYRSMTDAAVRLDAALVQIMLLVEQLREEGVEISF